MPNKEGIETILELRRRDPTVRIVAMTGGGAIGVGSILDVARKLGPMPCFTSRWQQPISSQAPVLYAS